MRHQPAITPSIAPEELAKLKPHGAGGNRAEVAECNGGAPGASGALWRNPASRLPPSGDKALSVAGVGVFYCAGARLGLLLATVKERNGLDNPGVVDAFTWLFTAKAFEFEQEMSGGSFTK